MSRNRALFPLLVTVLFLVPGCTQIMDSIVEPRATLNANPLNIQVGDTVGFDGREIRSNRELSPNTCGILAMALPNPQ